MNRQPHTSVLLEESVAALALAPGDIAVDCTVGAGGHTSRLWASVAPKGQVIGLDRDESALSLARTRLEEPIGSGGVRLVKARFSEVASVLDGLDCFGQVQGILADIGVSSMHLDEAERGFSFQSEGPLDMRMDQTQGQTAAELLATADEAELVRIFRDFGEEPKARPIARRLVQVRDQQPLRTTRELAELVKEAARYPTASRKHPATRVFQALRIAVNDELGELTRFLASAFDALRPGGRLAVISFHSLEDRIVKDTFLDLAGRRARENLPRDLPLTGEQARRLTAARGEIVKPFPLVPSEPEIQQNPRARSAKLRVLTKLPQ